MHGVFGSAQGNDTNAEIPPGMPKKYPKKSSNIFVPGCTRHVRMLWPRKMLGVSMVLADAI
jgi:hypothetical protein